MKISVIIPTFHRDLLLSKCLNKLVPGNQTLSSDHYEVIVTDDGKDHKTEKMIREWYPWVKWVKGPGMGPAANRNNGANYAEGNWLVFTDDDCLPDSNWLMEYCRAIETYPDFQVFEGRTYADRKQKSFNECAPINETGGNMPSCNFMIQKKTFLSFNGFDGSFSFYFEDMDLSYRLKQAGLQLKFISTAAVCHPWRTVNALEFWKNRNIYANAYWKFITKNDGVLKSHTPRFFAGQLVKDIFNDTIMNCMRYKGRGILFNLTHRMVHVDLFIRSLFLRKWV